MSDTLDATTDTPPVLVQPGAPDGAHFMPSGHWVVLRDPHELKRRDKKEIIRAANVEGISGIDSGYEVTEGLLLRLITAWSYAFPIPAEDRTSLDEVPAGDEDPLFELLEPARGLLFPGNATPDDHADERSPTAPSDE